MTEGQKNPQENPFHQDMSAAVSGLAAEHRDYLLEDPAQAMWRLSDLEGSVSDEQLRETASNIADVAKKYRDPEAVRREDESQTQKLLGKVAQGESLTGEQVSWIFERDERRSRGYA